MSKDYVALMKKEHPKMISAFMEIQRTQLELFCKKQHDYGSGNISVGTELKTKAEIKLSLTGIWFRMNDKIQRLKNLLLNDKVNAVDESIEDAFLDLSNYGIMAIIVKMKLWGK